MQGGVYFHPSGKDLPPGITGENRLKSVLSLYTN
jgi:hypothetical protein